MLNALKRRRWLGLTAVVVGLVVSAALGAIAYASIPDAGGVIHGCYKNGNGDLRVIDSSADSCKSSETGLNWNKQGIPGPQGPQGAQGPQGQQGPQGPEGTGHAYTATSGGFVTIHGSTDVITLSGLPAGTYLVWSPVEVVGDNDDGTNNTCLFVVNGSTLVLGEGDTFMYDGKDNGFGRADMFAIVTVPTDNSSIATRCDANTDGAQEFGRTTALKVGAVN